MNGCEKVFHTMKEKGMDLAVLLDPADIKYVSGFEVPFWPAWMGDVSNGLPMVTAILDAKREQIQLVLQICTEIKLFVQESLMPPISVHSHM